MYRDVLVYKANSLYKKSKTKSKGDYTVFSKVLYMALSSFNK